MIDARIISHLEKICHHLQRNTGITNFHLARFAGLLFIAACLRSINFTTWHEPWWAKVIVLAIIGGLGFQFELWVEFGFEPMARDSLRRGLKNPIQSSGLMIGLRNGCLIGVVFGYILPTFIPIAGWVYLISCTPLPPGESRLKKWLKGLAAFKLMHPASSQT